MRLAIIESPFRADTEAEHERNLIYLDLCLRDSILRGESPYASHKLLPGALDEETPSERDLGIRCGYAWWRAASVVAFYTDLGWSPGMMNAYKRARTQNIKIETRSLLDAHNPHLNPQPFVPQS